MLENKKTKRIKMMFSPWASYAIFNFVMGMILLLFVSPYSSMGPFAGSYVGLGLWLHEYFKNTCRSDGRQKCFECEKRIGLGQKYYRKVVTSSFTTPGSLTWDYGYNDQICKSCRLIKKLRE